MEFWPIFDIFHGLRPYLCSKQDEVGFHKQPTHRRRDDEPFFYSGVDRSWLGMAQKWSILDQKWPNMAGLSTLQSGPKGPKRDQNGQPKCFWPLGWRRTLSFCLYSHWAMEWTGWMCVCCFSVCIYISLTFSISFIAHFSLYPRYHVHNVSQSPTPKFHNNIICHHIECLCHQLYLQFQECMLSYLSFTLYSYTFLNLIYS